jgi:hypothetical protein
VKKLNIEDTLEGETNFRVWNEKVLLVLEENDLKEYFEGVVASPSHIQELAAHKKKEVKEKKVFL